MAETILVVDDNEQNAIALRRVLGAEGYSVVVEGGGAEALEYLRSHPAPALILLDLVMPDGSGWSFRRAQLADPKLAHIPVVVMSGLDAAPGMQGTVGFLPKPIERDRLLELVRGVVR